MNFTVPSGGIAYNVNGYTLHRCLHLPVDPEKLVTDMTEEKQVELSKKLPHLLMLIIDKRSMISSDLFAGTGRNMRHCVYNQQNQQEKWGVCPLC